MRVLLLFPMADGQTGPAIKYAFEKLGHEVRAVDAKLQPHDSYKVAYDFKPDLVFCSRTQALTWKVSEIKARFKNAVTCMWNVDIWDDIEKWTYLFPLIRTVDYHFVLGHNQLDEWRVLNARTHWLPQGLQDEVYDRPHSISEEDRRRYACDVCFCGSLYDDRETFLNAVEQAGFKLNYWGCRGKAKLRNEEHNKQVALAKVNLGCTNAPIATRQVSVRDYKIMGAGGFLLTRYTNELERLFPLAEEDRVADCFRTPDELVEKIRYWLSNEEERAVVAECAYRWVHANATYTHRIRMALDYMK